MTFNVGDRVRIETPDEMDPDHNPYGKTGEISGGLPDDTSVATGDPQVGSIYQVELDIGGTVAVRVGDSRPPT